MINKVVLQKIIDFGLLFTLIFFPFSVNISIVNPSDLRHPLFALNFSMADLLICIVFLLWCLKLLLYKEWNQVKLPSAPIWFFLAIGGLSFLNASSMSQWLKVFILFIEYFLIFYILLINNLKAFSLPILKLVLFISTSFILVMAFIQYLSSGSDPYLVRGLFENRNIFGAFLCIVIPLIYVELIHSIQIFRIIWMILLLALSMLVLTSVGAIISILVSLFIINIFLKRRIFLRFT